ncbi:hypothetical protein KCU62_g9869, partial [Aureobasidium sp. EXF-3399]
GHSQLKTGHPVRSAIHKQLNGRLVLRWVTTWESLLLYVLTLLFLNNESTYSDLPDVRCLDSEILDECGCCLFVASSDISIRS